MSKKIYVTRPLLPPLEEYVPMLEEIWANAWLTNAGPFHEKLEAELARHLGVEHLSLFANGTLALMTALEALHIKGEVITTPFSFVATAHSLLWNGIKPVFVDVDPGTLNLNPALIERAITKNTSAIMPVHVYGRPCDVDAIRKIADKHGLKVIYDAAHAFGVRDRGKSVLRHGDLSILSFHATKIFTTFEGGAIVCRDAKAKRHIDHLKNFGFSDEVTVKTLGINGKMNEPQAAFGLLQLRYIDAAIARRRQIDGQYRRALSGVKGIRLLEIDPRTTYNYAYFPILVEREYRMSRNTLFARFRERDIVVRRYFYPLISDFPMYRKERSARPANLRVARAAADAVLCLPIYPALSDEDVRRVVRVIAEP